MTSAELAVAAALGASALTALASLGVVWLRDWLSGRAAGRDALLAAVTQMLSRSMAVMMRAQAMGLQMRFRSGLGEGVDVALRVRKPSDALELHDWMATDLAPLNEAWSVIWARGDQETIRLANHLLSACSDLIGAATATAPAETAAARLRRFAAGERWTPELQAGLDRSVKAAAHARKDLALHVRRKLGMSDAELFTPEIPEIDAAGEPGVPAEADGHNAQHAPQP